MVPSSCDYNRMLIVYCEIFLINIKIVQVLQIFQTEMHWPNFVFNTICNKLI